MVVALQANYLEVELEAPPVDVPPRLLCTRRTRLNHRGAAVHVGDRVGVEAIDRDHARAVVAEVDPRSSFLGRPPVANASCILVAVNDKAVASNTHQVHRSSFVKEQFQVPNQYVDISIAGDAMNSWAIGTPTVLVMIMEVLTAMLD